jgi:hypothetical protein
MRHAFLGMAALLEVFRCAVRKAIVKLMVLRRLALGQWWTDWP